MKTRSNDFLLGLTILLSLALIDARNHTLRWLAAFEPHLVGAVAVLEVDAEVAIELDAARQPQHWR